MRPGRTVLFSFVFVMLGFGMLIQAAEPPGCAPSPGLPAGNMLSPMALLKPDGTLALDRGLSGAVDLQGWNVTLDGRRGPVLTPKPLRPESRTASTWLPLANHGLNDCVYALVAIGTDLYVGGAFTQTADGSVTNLNHIAKYSGGVWSPLANKGLDGYYVDAFAAIGTDLYVGGMFTQTADGGVTNLNNIAKYSGGVWSPLANNGLGGVGPGVYALAVRGTDLYVGGKFKQTADGSVTNLNNIAKYTGGAWSALPNNGLNSSVFGLAVVGEELYVGGWFSRTADGSVTNLNNIAKYTGGAWSALPNNGLNSSVYALAVIGDNLYVGGVFTQTADGTVTNLNLIAKYTGGAWSAVANNGLGGVAEPFVEALAAVGTDLYVGGGFTQSADGSVTNVNSVARYTGGAWSAVPNNGLGGVAEPFVQAFAAVGNDLYVGGGFTQTADASVTNLYNIAKLSAAPSGPTITSITSKTGKPGKPATINGSGFSANKSDNKVYFGKSSATVKKATTTNLTVTIPSKCKSGRTYGVYVNVKGTRSNTVQFKAKLRSAPPMLLPLTNRIPSWLPIVIVVVNVDVDGAAHNDPSPSTSISTLRNAMAMPPELGSERRIDIMVSLR